MKKLQFIIIISTVLLASYAFPANYVIRDDVDSFCLDAYRSRHSELSTVKHGSPDYFFLFTAFLGRPAFSTDVADIESDNIETDIDLPEEPEVSLNEMTLVSSPIIGASVLTERCPAAALFCFPLEAYRLRI